MATSPNWRWTPSSTPPTRRSWAAGGGGRGHSSSGRTRPAGRVRPAGRMQNRRGQDHHGPPAPGQARHPHRGPGVAWGNKGEPELLARCYRSVLELAEKHGLKSVAFPSISTGAFGFPVERACRIALGETVEYTEKHPSIGRVVFVCFDERTNQAYLKAYGEIEVK